MDYFDIYKKRLNRYGTDFQSRIQNQRERDFENYLLKSVYTVEFSDGGKTELGSFEPYKQDETETLHYLLTRININMPAGKVIEISDKDGKPTYWMIYYLEHMKASGYNRYIMLRMTHFVVWKTPEGEDKSSWAYMYGQENNMLKDEIRSRSRMDTIYAENLKSSFFVMPKNQFIKKDCYFSVGDTRFREYYRVTGYDAQSTPGVEYVTIDPIYKYDFSENPKKTEESTEEEFFWLDQGGTD